MSDLDLNPFDRTGDIADHAAVQTENDLKLAMYRHKIDNHNDELVFTGFCHFCGAPIDEGKFCPADLDDGYSCAVEYQREKDAKARNGLK